MARRRRTRQVSARTQNQRNRGNRRTVVGRAALKRNIAKREREDAKFSHYADLWDKDDWKRLLRAAAKRGLIVDVSLCLPCPEWGDKAGPIRVIRNLGLSSNGLKQKRQTVYASQSLGTLLIALKRADLTG